MFFPMDKLHVSETWHELAIGLHNTNFTANKMLQLVMTDAADVLFCKEQRVWLFAAYMSTRVLDDWKVMHLLSGWSLQGQLMRKPIMEDLLEYGKQCGVTMYLFNHGCPWLMTFTGGVEWLRPKW